MPGESTTVDINFTIASDFTGTSFVNTTEISEDNSEEYVDSDGNVLQDVDSDPDGDSTNDLIDTGDTDGDGIPDTLDEDIDGDGIPNNQDDDSDGDGIPNSEDEATDEDDHDPEELMIGQIYDLALTKRLLTPAPYAV